ncbi:MAG: hypothetical protein P8I83_07600, partial [Paracoccaceae bacterium]|nr:hypothetical protein [Paracoccaceae bacterium]
AVKAKDAGVTTVTFNDDGDGDNLVINSAFNQSTLRLNLDDGDNTFDGSAFTGVLTVAVTEAVADAAADTHTVTGGTGTTDELLITADGTGIDTTDMANFTAFEKLTIANDSSTGTIVINTATVADNATLTVNATAITTASNTFTLNASAETNGIIVVQGSAGIDTITMTQSDQADNISLGAANDIVHVLGNHLTSADTVNGGDGNDTISFSGDETVILSDFTNLSNVETLTAASSIYIKGNLGSLAASAGISTVTFNDDGDDDNLVIDAEFTSTLTVNLDDGDNTLNASAYTGTITAAIAEAIADAAADTHTITGGTGSGDIILVTADGTGIDNADMTTLTKFEKLTIANNASTGTIVLDELNIDDGKTFTVDSSSITTASNTFTLNAADDTNGILVVTGSAGIDTITMSSSDQGDNLSLAGANDIIYVAANHLTSSDTINGGDGTDTLSYTSDEAIILSDFTNISNLETLTSSNSVQITGNLGALAATAGIITINFNDDGDGDNLVIDSEFNNTLRVNLDDGDNTLNASAYAGTITIAITEAIADAAADTHTITGGTGTADEIIITADGTGIDTADMSTFTNFEKLTIQNNASTGSIVINTLTVADGSTLTVNSSAITTSSNTFTLDASAETDGALVVTGSAGIDTISMTQSDIADALSLAGANDIINVAGGQLTSADSINAGTGTDTLSYSSDEAIILADFTNVLNLETLTSANSVQITGNLGALAATAGITTVTFNDDGDGDNLVIDSEFNNTLRVNLDDGDNLLNASAYTGTLTVAITEAIADAAADTHTISGGTGLADEILITADGTGIDTTDMATLTGFEKITVANNASTGTIVINTATVADGSTLTVDSSAITTSSNTFTLDASAETDGILVVNGSAGIDTITMTQSDQADTLSLGGAADIIKVATGNLTSVDTINGGAGTDILKMTDASTVIDADFTNITNLESITQNTASHGMNLTLGSASSSAGLVTVTGGTGTNTVTVGSGYTGALTVALAAGTDTVNGSAQTSGSLTVTTAQDSITSADTITGGSATDTLTITGGGTALAAGDLTNVTAFSTISTSGNSTFGITTNNNNVAAGTTVTFNANSMTSTVLTFDASAEADGAFIITATGSGDHIITGSAGADTITMGAGANTIIGGDKADTFTTAGGNDIIKWTGTTATLMAAETGAAKGTENNFSAGTIGDKVADFTTGSDKFHFAAAALTNATGTETDTLNTITSGGVVANTNRFVEVTTALADNNMSTAIALLDGLTTSAVAVGDSFMTFLNDGTDGYLYMVEQASTSDTIAAADVTLIAQITGITDVANGDFVSF